MTDENRDRGDQNEADQSPPPLVPPPVRRNDTGEQLPLDRQQSPDEPVFVEPTTDRASDDDGPNGTRAYEPVATDDATDGPVGRDLVEDRPADPAYDEARLDPAPQSVASSPIPTVDPPLLDGSPTASDTTVDDTAAPDDTDSDGDDDAVDDRDRAEAEQPYQPVSARSTADDQEYVPVSARSSDDTSARDVATARQNVRDTSRDAEAVSVASPTTSPSAPPQPVFVPASDGGTERTSGFPPATGQQREFVQPPVPPKKKGNRGIGSLIALLSVILFAVLYALVAAGIIAAQSAQSTQSFTDIFTAFLVNPLFWVPAIIFVVAFVIVVLLANRAAWWAYVLGSLLVGALVYFGTIGVGLLIDNVFAMTPSEALDRFLGSVPNPFIIAAGLVAREVALWTGSAIAVRGRRVKERNVTAKDEYDRASTEHRAEYERAYSPAG